jgi:Ca-activated chloride channel family protein
VVIAIWESRLNAIRQTVLRQEIGWTDLLGVLNAPKGWSDYGIEGGGRPVFYGHTDPRASSTGLSAVIAEYYAAAHNAGYTDRRLTRDIVLDPDVLSGVRQIEQLIRHYAVRTDEYLNLIAQGPDYVDFVALEEADVLFLNGAFADQGFAPDIVPPEPLVALYPREGTVWHERPVGIVNADWVTPEQRAAAQVFVNYLLSPTVQTEIVSHGFRPVASPVNPGYPIVEEFGVNPRGPQTILDMPDTETIITIQQNWSLVKKPVDLFVLIDTSGSMNDDKKLEQAIIATPALIAGMEGSDRAGLAVFGDTFQVIQPVAPISLGQAGVLSGVENLQANGGTDLNTAVRDAVTIMNNLGDSNRIRAVVVLSDGVDPGQDGAGLEEAVQAITASQDDLNPVMVIPIAYGTDADVAALNDFAIASRTNAFSSDPDNIGATMQIIGSFWGS